MKSRFRRLVLGAVACGCLGLTSCDDDGYDGHGSCEPVGGDSCYSVQYPYLVEVQVFSWSGLPIPYAGVELVVAAVPETCVRGSTDRYGTAFFQIYAPLDVAVVAYAEAPGYGSNASDVGTRADTDYLLITVFL